MIVCRCTYAKDISLYRLLNKGLFKNVVNVLPGKILKIFCLFCHLPNVISDVLNSTTMLSSGDITCSHNHSSFVHKLLLNLLSWNDMKIY